MLIRILIISFILFFEAISFTLFAQENNININSINLGVTKLNNTFETKGIINYKADTDFGTFFINNIYTGNVITNIQNSFRDAEYFNFEYKYPILENLFVISDAKYNLLADRNPILSNKLENISEQIGINYTFNKLSLKAIYGLQYNKQTNLEAIGNLINTSLTLKEISFDNWNNNSEIITEHLILNDGRYADDINFNSKLYKQFSKEEFFNVEIQYKKQARDFIQIINNENTINNKNYATETNNENRFGANLQTKFKLFNNLNINLESEAAIVDVERKYENLITEISNSKTERNYSEWLGNINSSIDFKHHKLFFHNLGIYFENRTEHYYLENIHNLNIIDFNAEQLLETQKDNNNSNIKLYHNLNIAVTNKDSIRTNISLSKTIYNTPSTNNKDERDLLNHIFNLEYKRQCSKILTITSALNYSQNHIVFINNERSSQNNWNKIISFRNGIIINTNKIFYAPQFEILANYTIYDFENFNQPTRSYSIRQISYKDSLDIIVSNKINITNKINARYYEQSKLFWNNFAEQPQRQSLDFNSNLICKYNLNKIINFGIGTRFFYLNTGIINNITNQNTIFSVAPETLLIFKMNKWQFNCNSYLEFRNENNKNKLTIPHFNINTTYIL